MKSFLQKPLPFMGRGVPLLQCTLRDKSAMQYILTEPDNIYTLETTEP